MAKVNVELVRRIQKHIREEPLRLNMGIWSVQGFTGEHAPPCGTVACIAGWACILEDGKIPSEYVFATPRRAAKLLFPDGRDGRATDRIFLVPFWPRVFRWLYHRRDGYTGTGKARVYWKARVTIWRLEWLVWTGR